MINAIIHKFERRCNKNRALIVAIDGLGGAGKTTFVKKLEDRLKRNCLVNVIHIDDHIVESNKRYNTGFAEWYEYYYLQWNIELIKKDILKKLHCNKTEILLPFYDCTTNLMTNRKMVVATDSILLIEGIFLQRHEWRKFYDYTLFLQCSRTIREERVLSRDSYMGDLHARMDKYKSRYWQAEAYYMKKENPLQQADKIYHVSE
ncbi:kinase [Lysinibacillus parviboronicapiens]|uniref:kinase n=1 Tax=Lysinibacillus parviboronicapiens TaxID=436516 RepID=UPI001EE6D682|nr:kinase [Lysinibacillus parviboronicapiens]